MYRRSTADYPHSGRMVWTAVAINGLKCTAITSHFPPLSGGYAPPRYCPAASRPRGQSFPPPPWGVVPLSPLRNCFGHSSRWYKPCSAAVVGR